MSCGMMPSPMLSGCHKRPANGIDCRPNLSGSMRREAEGKDTEWAGTSDENQLTDYAGYNAKRVEPVGSKKPNGSVCMT